MTGRTSWGEAPPSGTRKVSVPRIVAFLKNLCAAVKLLENLFTFILFAVSEFQAKASGADDFFTGTKRISTRRSRAAAIRLSIAIECPS